MMRRLRSRKLCLAERWSVMIFPPLTFGLLLWQVLSNGGL